jgi:hypothetical protein
MKTAQRVSAAIVVASAMLVFATAPSHADAGRALTGQQWRDDLHYLASQLAIVHQGAFHTVSRSDFEKAMATVDARIPSLSDREIELGFARLVAMLGEGHTRISLPGLPDPMSDVDDITPAKLPQLAFHRLPISLYTFSNGTYVIAASPRYVQLIGSQVLEIGGRPIQSVLQATAPFVNRDNDGGALLIEADFVTVPEILHVLGLASADGVTLRLLGATHQQETVVVPAVAGSYAPSWTLPVGIGAESKENFWAEYREQSNAIYVRINVLNDGRQTLASFADSITKLASAHPNSRAVIDLRQCRGGDNELSRSLLLEFIRDARINRLGQLFVLVDRGTFSAAVNFAGDLERLTNAILVGEPPSGAPGSWGDPQKITLPNSGLIARVSTRYWSDWMAGSRPEMAADIPIQLSSSEYFSGRDPAMAAALRFRSQPDFSDALGQVLSDGAGIDSVIRLYYRQKTDPLTAARSTEEAMQRAGALFTSRHAYREALIAFEINARDYPSSLEQALQTVSKAASTDPEDSGLHDLLTELQKMSADPNR